MTTRTTRLAAGVSIAALMAASTAAHATIITTGTSFNPVNVAGDATASFVAIAPNDSGAMTVNGGSQLTMSPRGADAGQINVGGDQFNGTSGSGALTVSGTGSTIRFTGPESILVLGRFGTSSTATLDVVNGGAIDMSAGFGMRIGRGNTNAGFGTDGATGTARVSGPGSRITINGVDSAGAAPGIMLGRDNGTGRLTVENGGVVTLDTTATSSSAFVTLGGRSLTSDPTLAASSGTGTALITGAGSRLSIGGAGGFINVGNFGSTTTGTLTVNDRGRLETVFLGVGIGQNGANGSTGTAIVDGAGSVIALAGRGRAGEAPGGTIGDDLGRGAVVLRNGGLLSVQAAQATQSGGGFTIGRDGGTGSVVIETGGRLEISGNNLGNMGFTAGRNGGTGTVEVRSGGTLHIETPTGASTAGSGMTAGRDAGSTGTIRIDGGSVVIDAKHDTIVAAGGGIASRSGAFIGRGGTGLLEVANGGRLAINASAAETTVLQIGGNFSTDPANLVAGNGTVDVRGTGSRIDMTGEHARIIAGRWGDASRGDLRVSAGGQVTGNRLYVGIGEAGSDGSRGNVEVSGAGSRLTLAGVDAAGAGALAVIGRDANGRGTLSISDAGVVVIDPTGASATSSRVGMTISGNAGASGSVTLDRTGQLQAGQFLGVGATFAAGAVSDTGTASLTLRSGSSARADQVHVGADGDVSIARSVLAADSITLRQGASLVLDAGVAEARVLEAFNGASIGGIGSLNVGTVTLHAGATLAPGFSPGTIRIAGDLVTEAGARLLLDFVENPDGTLVHDLIEVTGLLGSSAEIEILLAGTAEFADVVGRSLSTFLVDETGAGLGGAYDGRAVTVRDAAGRTARYDVVGSIIGGGAVDPGPGTPVPAPATLGLLLASSGAVLLMRRRRR